VSWLKSGSGFGEERFGETLSRVADQIAASRRAGGSASRVTP
jgi:hypothetical protein